MYEVCQATLSILIRIDWRPEEVSQSRSYHLSSGNKSWRSKLGFINSNEMSEAQVKERTVAN